MQPRAGRPSLHRGAAWPTRALASLGALAATALVLLWPALAAAQDDAFTRSMEKGPVFAGLAALVGGLAVSLTPCVYPMIAITVSVFGAREAKSRKEAMLLSTCFVFGIVVLFTSMLVGAALTGAIFGKVLSNPWVMGGIAVIFIALAASMFGAFEMTLPDALMQRLSSVGGIGYGGAFLLGLVSGLIAAPCTGPVLTGILFWIGKTQNVLLGTVVGTTFSIGLGLPFWLVGTFAVALPKGGKWMLWVKSFFGIVLLIVAFHFLQTAIPALAAMARPGTQFRLIMLGAILFGLALGAVHLSWDDGGTGVKFRKGLGIVATVVGGFLLWANLDMADEAGTPIAAASESGNPTEAKKLLTWGHSEKEAATVAQTEKRPLMVDFTADWCAACKEMDKHTFSDPRVKEKAAHFVAVKVDASDDEDTQIEAVKKKYGVVGLPTVVVYDSTGKERKRFNEFVGPEAFLAAIEGIN